MAQEPNELTRRQAGAGTGQDKRDPDEIMADIRRTRAEMSVLAGEVRTRYAPDKLKAQAREQVRDVSTERAKHMAEIASMKAKEYGRSMMDGVKSNPIPVALTAAGIGWLMWSARKENRERDFDYGYLVSHEGLRTESPYFFETSASPCDEIGMEGSYEERVGVYESHEAQLGEGGPAGGKTQEYKQRAGETAQQYRERMNQYRQRMSGKAQEYKQRAGETAQQYRQRMSDMARRSRERARDTGQRLQYRYEHNPLGMGLAAMALGALTGALFKESRWEHETMGQYRDQMVEQAREAGKERLQQAKGMARETLHEAKERVSEKMHEARERMESKAEQVGSRTESGSAEPVSRVPTAEAPAGVRHPDFGDTRPRSELQAQEEPTPMDKPSKLRYPDGESPGAKKRTHKI